MMEAAVVIDLDGNALFWHLPDDRSGGAIPDSQDLWEIIWENRDRVAGIAHSHPGSGLTRPSHTDVTTFAAIEAAFGRRLKWWITTSDRLIVLQWKGPEKHQYIGGEVSPTGTMRREWLNALREHSNYPAGKEEHHD